MTDPTMPMDDSPDKDAEQTRATPTDGPKTITVFLTERGMDQQQLDVPRHTRPDGLDSGGRASGKDRYAVGGELARGGMGAVLSAKDLNLRRDVAMKIVLNPKAAKDQQILRFVHEAQVTGQLEHPSIVPVHELGVDADDNLYYTMKFIRGANLGDILKGIREGDVETIEKYPLQRLLNIYIKACEALAFAHSRGVIHRDLKPDNIMVGDFGEVLIVDWGLAKVLGNLSAEASAKADVELGTPNSESESGVESVRDSQVAMNTMAGAVMGTPAYMPPEQADGDIEALGPAADVYSMGAILYAILTLEAPVQGRSAGELLEKVLKGTIEAPELHEGDHPHCPNGAIPTALSSVAMKAMSYDADDRYGSTQALQTDVQAYLDGFATSAEGAGLWRLVQLFVGRHKAMVIAGLSAFVILTVVIATSFVINVQARQTAERERGAAFIARSEAESALQAYKDEQARGIESRKTAAPAMIRAAEVLIEKGELENATVQTALAREYHPELAPAHLLAAQLAIVEANYEAAQSALSEYLGLEPEDELAQRLVEICRDAASRPADEAPTLAFAQTISEQGNWQLANRLTVDADKALALYQKRIAETWGGINHLSQNVLMRPDGKLRITSSPARFTSIKALAGMPIAELRLRDGHGILDLAPLSGMPLEKLSLGGTTANNLAPVAGAQLVDFELRGSRIDDISALAGMPLESVRLSWNAVSSLEPLRGAPVRELFIDGLGKLRDIEALAGMPLERFSLTRAPVSSIAPLAGASALRELQLENTRVCDLSPLRGLKLRSLSLYTPRSNGFSCEPVDLGALEGMPLSNLFVRVYAKNAEALSSLPLESLCFYNAGVTNLAFMRGMPVRRFISLGDNVQDLSPLQDLPLVYLNVSSYKLTDLSPIARMKDLEHLSLRPEQDPLLYLDHLPNLKTIGKETVHAYRARRAAEAAAEKE